MPIPNVEAKAAILLTGTSQCPKMTLLTFSLKLETLQMSLKAIAPLRLKYIGLLKAPKVVAYTTLEPLKQTLPELRRLKQSHCGIHGSKFKVPRALGWYMLRF